MEKTKMFDEEEGTSGRKKLKKDLQDDWSILARSKKLTRIKFADENFQGRMKVNVCEAIEMIQ